VPSARSSIYDPLVDPKGSLHPSPRAEYWVTSLFRWWLPEIFASALSIDSLLSIVVLLQAYNGTGIDRLDLPNWLALNGIVATISTFNRICLMLPVGAAVSQEAWLWFSAAEPTEGCTRRLRDLELSNPARESEKLEDPASLDGAITPAIL